MEVEVRGGSNREGARDKFTEQHRQGGHRVGRQRGEDNPCSLLCSSHASFLLYSAALFRLAPVWRGMVCPVTLLSFHCPAAHTQASSAWKA